MDRNFSRQLFPYLITIVVVGLMVGLRGSVLAPVLGDRGPFSGFTLGILAAAWIGGLWPGILATLLSGVAGWFLFMAPNWQPGAQRVTVTVIFFLTGILVSVVCESLHRARRRAEAANAELRKSQQKLRDSEGRFRNLADSAPVLIWMSDAAKNRTWLNRPWLDFTGRTMDDELGRGWEKGVHPADLERYREVYSASFDTRQPFEMDYRLRRHDGVYRWVLDRGIPISSDDGSFAGYMGGVIDINERKSAEENSEALLRIEQAARVEAERAALMKDEFLATVSHEMRTPLTAMLGWVQMLRSGSLSGDAVPHALETIERNARAQAKLINDLLDMSRILSGRLRLDVQRVNVTDVVEAAIATAEPAAAAKKIHLLRKFETEPESISGDATRLQQVVWNLLNNAIKFTPSGGEVTVAMKRVDAHLEISVTDNGEGIDPKFLPHVFERFRQQDSSTERRHQGLGLGLSIVKQLIELHGGSVRAESEGSGRGASFIVTIPLANGYVRRAAEPLTPRKETDSPHVEAPPSLLGVKVLVVDDDNDARELLRSILAHHGASVRTAASAAEAIKEFTQSPPQIVVSDIGMPGEDGYELIRKIRALDQQEGRRVPAVALTAFARSEDRRRAIGAGFNMHLSKPVEPAELLTIVASLTRHG